MTVPEPVSITFLRFAVPTAFLLWIALLLTQIRRRKGRAA